MKKIPLSILLFLFPVLAMADSNSLSFAPPASDWSVVFLGDIFGIVDGILHGTGSQIMGSMFGVFNSAVLALGGIVIMYTLLVSTMNTAHEGQMLGQKWSSIYIPIRSTIGLALLIPKASGYCLMQIFVMWIVVQGVGAADKVWNAALSYLNRGGVIIQAQMDPTKSLTQAATAGIPGAAQTMLAGQVCMIGLQKQLASQLEAYLSQKQSNSGPCSGSPSPSMKSFCESSVPDFVNTVDPVQIQQSNPTNSVFTAYMPNFPTNSIYQALNGICGTIVWHSISAADLANVQKNIPSITDDDIKTASKSRAAAILMMYSGLTNIAQIMVGNDPAFSKQTSDSSKSNFSLVAKDEFGVPHTSAGPVCTDSTTPNCIVWGNASGYTIPTIFSGNEFQGAIQDYDGTMLPTLNLIQQAQKSTVDTDSRAFIEQANTQGWIMAGSYFFNLVNLNVHSTTGDVGLVDTNTGLEGSVFDISNITSSFPSSGSGSQCSGTYAILCTWFDQDVTKVTPIPALINGSGAGIDPIPAPDQSSGKAHSIIDGAGSSTVYGFTNNSTVLQLPGQPGLQPMKFANEIEIKIDPSTYYLPDQQFDCGAIRIIFFSVCLGRMFGNLFYNDIFRWMYNFFLKLFGTFINQVVTIFLMIPLKGMALIFKHGIDIISSPGVNPIVALANMGTYYINFSGHMWLMMLDISITTVLIPVFGIFIFVMIALAMPIVMAWLNTMVSIGFITAYYVPVLPYMIFTFGAIAWLMAVIEAMVCAPIVALGITHPEGHDAFGKGESSIMILLNVFLRPSMMIIGYIAAIALSYVSVWIINAGFDNAIGFMQGNNAFGTGNSDTFKWFSWGSGPVDSQGNGNINGGYTGWAGIFAYFFSILIYTMMYVTVVQKSFGLISALPDKVLRWVGSQSESYGQESAQWAEETKGKVEKAGEVSGPAVLQVGNKLSGYAGKAGAKLKGGGSGGKASASGEEAGPAA